jgi:hypothetical protein
MATYSGGLDGNFGTGVYEIYTSPGVGIPTHMSGVMGLFWE